MKKSLVLCVVCMLQVGMVSAITNHRVEMNPSSFNVPTQHGNSMDRENAWMPQVNLEDNQLSFEPSDSPIYYICI